MKPQLRSRITAAAVCAVLLSAAACATGGPDHVKGATAVTEVFGDGQRLTAVALEYDREIDNSRLSASTFAVEGRTITKAYANTAPTPAGQGANGRYMIIELSPDDTNAGLYVQQGRSVTRKEAKASVTQTGPVHTIRGDTYAAGTDAITTGGVVNLIVDDFRQLEYTDPQNGNVLKYNLFVPKDYDRGKSYPLVLFMHDAGATSTVTDTTLVQGLGAVAWAGPSDQAKHGTFVVAPQ